MAWVGNAPVLAAVKRVLDDDSDVATSPQTSPRDKQSPSAASIRRHSSQARLAIKTDEPDELVHFRTISVDGESGLGKSRFLREVRARAVDWTSVDATADAVTVQRPFAVWFSILRALLVSASGNENEDSSPRTALAGFEGVLDDDNSPKSAGSSSSRTTGSSNSSKSRSRSLRSAMSSSRSRRAERKDAEEHMGVVAKFVASKLTRRQRQAYENAERRPTSTFRRTDAPTLPKSHQER